MDQGIFRSLNKLESVNCMLVICFCRIYWLKNALTKLLWEILSLYVEGTNLNLWILIFWCRYKHKYRKRLVKVDKIGPKFH